MFMKDFLKFILRQGIYFIGNLIAHFKLTSLMKAPVGCGLAAQDIT